MWAAVGKPRFGTEFDNMKTAKLAIREKEEANVNSFSDSLNDDLSSKNMDSFWRSWRTKFGGSRQPSFIDGYCDELDIADRFANVF